MVLTKQKVYQVEVTEDDHVQVRCKTLIIEDGEIISSSLHRHVITAGQDYTGEIGKVRRCCQAAHVPTVVDRETTRNLYETAKQAMIVATQAHDVAEVAERALAQTAMDDAVANRDTALANRDAAIAAHEKFIIDEA
jgi:hypothetical protein